MRKERRSEIDRVAVLSFFLFSGERVAFSIFNILSEKYATAVEKSKHTIFVLPNFVTDKRATPDSN